MSIFKKNNNKFIKSVMVVMSGTIAAQAITLLCAPIITRLYGPEAYGILGVFNAVLNIITPIAALTYPIAIVLSEKKKRCNFIRENFCIYCNNPIFNYATFIINLQR